MDRAMRTAHDAFIIDAAHRFVLAYGLALANPGDMLAICARDGAVHDLAHALDLPCPLCIDEPRPIESTPPL